MGLKVILISGKFRSGKTTLAEELVRQFRNTPGIKVFHTQFAACIYDLSNMIVARLKSKGVNVDETKKPRSLLQFLGTEYGRKEFGENVWVTVTQAEINDFYNHCRTAGDVVAIISDCRFENEFNAFPEALRVRLTASENLRIHRCEGAKPTIEAVNHPSETGLDHIPHTAYDMVFHTGEEENSPSHMATLIHSEVMRGDWVSKRDLVIIDTRNPYTENEAAQVGADRSARVGWNGSPPDDEWIRVKSAWLPLDQTKHLLAINHLGKTLMEKIKSWLRLK